MKDSNPKSKYASFESQITLETQLELERDHLEHLIQKYEEELYRKEVQLKNQLLKHRCNNIGDEGDFKISNEFEVTPYTFHDSKRVYSTLQGFREQVVKTRKGFTAVEFQEFKNLYKNTFNLSNEALVEGIIRNIPTQGSEYNFVSYSNKESTSSNDYQRVVAVRPYLALSITDVQKVTLNGINIIYAHSGHFDLLQSFLDISVKEALKLNDIRLIILSSNENSKALIEILTRFSKSHNFANYEYIKIPRGKSTFEKIKLGLQSCTVNLVTLFVKKDIIFTSDILQRCQTLTEGNQVYIPIPFSLYNPNNVYHLLNRKIPELRNQLKISKYTGFWNDEKYSTICFKPEDIPHSLPKDSQSKHWTLIEWYTKSSIKVIRATDPNLFHVWEPRTCKKKQDHQYRNCIKSSVLFELSHGQLGLLVFKDNITKSQDDILLRSNSQIKLESKEYD